jgi:hypothetical protein
MAMINTHLNTNDCALSSRKFPSPAPLFLNTEDMEFRTVVPLRSITKIRARVGNPRATKGATVGTQAHVGYRNTIWYFVIHY